MILSTEVSPARVCAGVDWSSRDHAVCIMGQDAVLLEQFVIDHNARGLNTLITRLQRAGVSEVGIERGDGPLVDALLDADLSVVVIAPGQVKNLRSRYGSTGNKNDRFDAYVLADTVRTDRARLRPLLRDSSATSAIRAMARTRRQLVATRVAVCNQLLAHLQQAFPGAIGLFSDLDSPISLSFLSRFTSQHDADWLSPKRLQTWLRSVCYPGRTSSTELYRRLQAAPRGATGPQSAALAAITSSYITVLQSLVTQIAALEKNLAEQLTSHPDAHIFSSLPRTKTVRTARLIGEIGDARGKFPTPESLAALAGVVPSTRQSGKVKTVTFRYGCNRHLRDALCDFADGSRHQNPWAADIYHRAINRKCSHQHAIRILARAWIAIIWRCWQDNTPYEPTKHHALQRLTTPNQAA